MSDLKITQCIGEPDVVAACRMCSERSGRLIVFSMCSLFRVEGYDGGFCSDCVEKIRNGILKPELTRCQRCVYYQPYEPDAGLLEGCIVPAIYADEDCQHLVPEVNNKIIGYMRQLGEGCPYFEKE